MVVVQYSKVASVVAMLRVAIVWRTQMNKKITFILKKRNLPKHVRNRRLLQSILEVVFQVLR